MASTTSSAITAFAAAAFGSLATIFVGGLDYFNRNKELDIELVNIGLSILRGDATGDENSIYARRFALRILNQYTGAPIPDEEFEAWARQGSTPFLKTAEFSDAEDLRSLASGIMYLYGICLGTEGILVGDHVEPESTAELRAVSVDKLTASLKVCNELIDTVVATGTHEEAWNTFRR
ncbi:hypothetical protein [Salinarimonas sp.]|uniref:hypothetical protein n=1 Tax=Salinarimonas sp. TaxID=2766526 RepID=UPI0032D90F90